MKKMKREGMWSLTDNNNNNNNKDPWANRTKKMRCATCMYHAPKKGARNIGRCRRHAPTMTGYPVVFPNTDWCGDHKLNENVVVTNTDDVDNPYPGYYSVVEKIKGKPHSKGD